jgi:hypothetical protein
MPTQTADGYTIHPPLHTDAELDTLRTALDAITNDIDALKPELRDLRSGAVDALSRWNGGRNRGGGDHSQLA